MLNWGFSFTVNFILSVIDIMIILSINAINMKKKYLYNIYFNYFPLQISARIRHTYKLNINKIMDVFFENFKIFNFFL